MSHQTDASRRVTATGLTLLLGGALALAAASPQSTPQQPSFAAQAEGVTVDVVVTDRAGAPVLDLKREDFAVSEDGVPQEIVAFDAVHRPAPAAKAAGTPPPTTLQPRVEPPVCSPLERAPLHGFHL